MGSKNEQDQKKSITPAIPILKLILTLVFIIGCCYLSGTYLPSLYLCENSVVETIPSPNGKYKVVTFLRDCGSTTAFTPHVSILQSGDKLRRYQEGNVFIGSYGETFIKAKWISDTHLVIRYTVYEELPTLKVDKKYDVFIDFQRGKRKQ